VGRRENRKKKTVREIVSTKPLRSRAVRVECGGTRVEEEIEEVRGEKSATKKMKRNCARGSGRGGRRVTSNFSRNGGVGWKKRKLAFGGPQGATRGKRNGKVDSQRKDRP